ncbi:MAG: hypothetical protein HDT35_02160 [Clostridiales bacterium]|nr:hypothetical protein [Clostridiales bacterium]
MGTSSYSMADIASLTKSTNIPVAKNSTSRTGNTELNMQDFLQLMVVQLQNQSIDDTMDTSEMMNQMVQMQMVTAITNMNEISVMTYASSMVGKVVTIGIVENNTLEEREVEVIGTGISNGQQVIFGRDGKGNVETYALNQIMAVGRLPEIQKGQGVVDEDGNLTDKTEGADKTEGTENNGNQTQEPDVDQTEGGNPAYNGEQGAPTD